MTRDRAARCKLGVGKIFCELALGFCNTSPHCALQTSSRRITSRGHSRANCAQSVILNEAHWAPSLVQMQLVQGDGKAESPTFTWRPPIWHPDTTFSRQALRSIWGIEWQGTRGFLERFEGPYYKYRSHFEASNTHKKLLGRSKAARCISPGSSMFSQKIFERVLLRNSVNWASEKRVLGSSFSYLIIKY